MTIRPRLHLFAHLFDIHSRFIRHVYYHKLHSAYVLKRYIKHDLINLCLFQVVCEGQVIGGIIAETQVQAQKAAKAVKVTYEELPPIVTIEVGHT